MRTTLSLDDDVAAALRNRQDRGGTRWRDLVNDVLRAGIRSLDDADETDEALRASATTEPVSLGRAKVDITNVTEALAAAEGDQRA